MPNMLMYCMIYAVLTRVAKCIDVDGEVFENVLY
jgi:hypothetical protein